MANYCRRFAARGYTCFAIEYRLTPEGPVPSGEGYQSDWIEPDSRIWLVDRAESSQIWSDQTRDADEFRFEEAEPELPDGSALVDEFDVQRFRIRLYEPGSGSGS